LSCTSASKVAYSIGACTNLTTIAWQLSTLVYIWSE